MFKRCYTILLKCIKVVAIMVLFFALPQFATAQTCDCVNESGCVPCEEGFVSITFEYSGDIGLFETYTVEDGDGILGPVFPQILTDEIRVNSRNPNVPFEDNILIITLFSTLLPDVREIEINTLCQRIQLGKSYDNGDFTITAARSIVGPLCCEPEDTDQVPPEFVNFPPDVTLSLENNCEVEYSWSQPTVIDDCGIAGFATQPPPNTQIFELGTRYISYSAIDLSNNIFTDSFAVTVIDEIPPAITNIPALIELDANNNCSAIADWTEPSASDNCEIESFSSDYDAGSAFPLGTTIVTYTAIDNSGNETERSFNVVVSDKTAPDLSNIPNDITVSANENCEAAVEWDLPMATDNCSNNVSLEGTSSPGDTFGLGTATVEYTATDEQGNSTSRSFKVTVKDDSDPVFSSFPENLEVPVGNSCELPITWETPVAEDNCSSVTLELLEGSPESGDIFTLGIYTVSYKASDANGNELIRSFEIEVVDEQDPVFSGCPQDIIVSAESSCDAFVEWESPQATDNCLLTGLTSNFESGTRFEIGTTEVRYVATDESGNEAECFFNVIVRNDFEPQIENCPQDVELELFDRRGVAHDWDEPDVNLECADPLLESNYSPGDLFPLGNTEVQYFYEINGERNIVCSFTVNVKLAEIELEVNQLMTPNGDGENDLWKISEIENFPNNTVTIVDRWGSEIYRTKGYNNESIVWDGSNKRGDLVPSGTYYYFITVEFESTLVEKNGFIELIR